MTAGLFYGSTHGKTRKVVSRVQEILCVKPDVYDVKNLIGQQLPARYDLFFFFCPNYGDEELQPDMEVFITNLHRTLDGKLFVVCELGNYYGYDNFHFGALRIIRKRLIGLQARELCEPLSLDTYPRTNWKHLDQWVEFVNQSIIDYDRR